MRINVYEEELTFNVQHVVKTNVIGEDGRTVTFHGIRIILKGSDDLHFTEHDDDRPAITFWSQNYRSIRQFLRAASQVDIYGTETVNV